VIELFFEWKAFAMPWKEESCIQLFFDGANEESLIFSATFDKKLPSSN
jgi:hypothetical protein